MGEFFIRTNLYWILPLIILEVVLKAFALWKAAKNNQLYWFIVIIFINTAGLLPLIYLLFFSNKEKKH